MEPETGRPSRARAVARLAGRAAAVALLVPIAAWTLGALWCHPFLPGASGPLLAMLGPVALALAAARPGPRRRTALRAAAAAAAAVILSWPLVRPGPPPAWAPEFSRAPRAEIAGNEVRVFDVRDFRWSAEGIAEEAWKDARYPLDGLVSADLLVVPFSEGSHMAHAMLAFGWRDRRRLCVSVEARRAAGVPYHPVPGMYRRYDLHYVLAEESDTLRLRAAVRGDRIHLYPLDLAPADSRRVLLDVLARVNELHGRREYYHSLLSSCASTLAAHGHAVAPDRIPRWDLRIAFPSHSPKVLRDAGLLRAPGPWEEFEESRRVDRLAAATPPGEGYSEAIRAADGVAAPPR
jgi:hypothetical protein